MLIKLEGGRVELCTDYVHQRYGLDTVSLYSLYVEPSYRRQGIAKRLLRAAFRWADEHNVCIGAHIGPFADQPCCFETLKKFYRKMGFLVIDEYKLMYIPKGLRPEGISYSCLPSHS